LLDLVGNEASLGFFEELRLKAKTRRNRPAVAKNASHDFNRVSANLAVIDRSVETFAGQVADKT
jgi:hypothetical protein